jgi:hypothetical protein
MAGVEKRPCRGCEERARRAAEALPTVIAGGVCPRCHNIHALGIRAVGDRVYQCADPRCAFRWSECVGCGS